MAKRIPRLGEIMIQKGWITWKQLAEALRIQNETSRDTNPSSLIKDPRMQRQTYLNIGEILLHQGWIKPEDLSTALLLQQETGDLLGGILIRKGFVTEKDLHHALAIQHGMTFAEIDNLKIPAEVIKLIPKHTAYEFLFLPLVKQDHLILIAFSNPLDIRPEDRVRQMYPDHEILCALMAPRDVAKGLETYYGPA